MHQDIIKLSTLKQGDNALGSVYASAVCVPVSVRCHGSWLLHWIILQIGSDSFKIFVMNFASILEMSIIIDFYKVAF